ncbi:hypothetical protein RSOLAG1IB_08168 [Rhizoctonia solani AG-1 IB]|uniref:F-box domain-containing protein n=1 Tax=Thanatephorus cucumeris (strain AG1-IB / isolate 7/3/14) TaxID=1108050 RepID=A0A0B7FGX4_THACB|nr:hypothetical protein RSOLAG1IB_08168 [Rhizoctonia solani AG-1 IB]
MSMSSNTSNAALKRWEDTRDLLAGAMRNYLDSCVYLNNTLGLRNRHISTMSIISRIESKLDLQYEMMQQLAQSTSTLAQTRNRFTSSVLVLPDEVLSQIFLYVVYDPENKDLPMEKYVRAVYRNLHNLLGVCSDWRNLASSQLALWQLLPATERYIKPEAVELCLKRSRGRGLNLALRSQPSVHGISTCVLKAVEKNAAQLRVLNLEVLTPREAGRVIGYLLQDGVFGQLSGLSIRYVQPQFRGYIYRNSTPYVIDPACSSHSEFERLVNSLSALRLDRLRLRWQSTTFSDQLVELVVYRVKLGESDLSIDSFASAISGARELRDLQIVAVTGNRGQVEAASPRIFPKTVLSKLRSLVLQGLSFSVLESLLMTIAPGSYHTIVELTRSIQLGTSTQIVPQRLSRW